jgi:hypothetical protein
MRRTRGITMIEVTAAIALVSVLALLVAQLLRSMAVQQRHLEQHLVARQLAANLLEAELSRPFADLELGVSSIDVPPAVERLLPRASVSLHVAMHAEEKSPGKRLAVAVDWGEADSPTAGRVQLAAWKFPLARETP